MTNEQLPQQQSGDEDPIDDSTSSYDDSSSYDEHHQNQPLLISSIDNENQHHHHLHHHHESPVKSVSSTMTTTTTTTSAPAIVVGGGRFTIRDGGGGGSGSMMGNSNISGSISSNGGSNSNGGNVPLGGETFSFGDILRLRFSRLLQSNFYHVLYVVMILLCLILLIWSIVQRGHPRHTLFLYLESIVTICLVLEVLMRLCFVEREAFFSSYWNWFDFIISILCVISFFAYLVKNIQRTGSAGDSATTVSNWEGFADTALISFRYFSQIARIILFIRKQRRQRELASQQYIDLTNTQGPDVDLSLIELQQNSAKRSSLRRSSLGLQQHGSSDDEEEETFSEDEEDHSYSGKREKQRRQLQEEIMIHMT